MGTNCIDPIYDFRTNAKHSEPAVYMYIFKKHELYMFYTGLHGYQMFMLENKCKINLKRQCGQNKIFVCFLFHQPAIGIWFVGW